VAFARNRSPPAVAPRPTDHLDGLVAREGPRGTQQFHVRVPQDQRELETLGGGQPGTALPGFRTKLVSDRAHRRSIADESPAFFSLQAQETRPAPPGFPPFA